jgi:hypothetical protein
MQTKLGWAVSALGVVCAVLGLAVMVVLGPDSRFTTGPHEIDTDGIAVVTAPKVISWKGVKVDVLAEVPVNKPVFVGIGNSVDVQNYIQSTRRLEVTKFRTPWSLQVRSVGGRDGLSGAPIGLDWWIASSAGLGGAEISALLPDETVSAAILSVGASNLQGLKVTYAYGIQGGFAKGLSLLLIGLGAVWAGGLVRRSEGFWEIADEDEGRVVARRRVPRAIETVAVEEAEQVEEVEEVVYLYVDEHGVEHEISADEAAEYEVVEVVVEDAEDELAEEVATDLADHDTESELRPRATTGVLTAADIAAGVEEPGTEPPPEPGRGVESEPPAPRRVVYVYVDDAGVEHEVGEHELDDFEIVDDELDGDDPGHRGES